MASLLKIDKMGEGQGQKTFIPMEPDSRKLVGESTTRRTRPRSNKPKSLAESPVTPHRLKKKNPRKRKADPGRFYSLGDPGILDQKEEKGKVYYLCNWADDPETGESFPPSWEPYDAVTLDEIARWQSRRWAATRSEQRRATETSEDRSGQRGRVDSFQESTQDSQPPRPAKRRRITHGPNPTSEEQPPAKKSRRVGTIESARFQSVFQQSIDQGEVPNEIKDSYEDDEQLSSSGGGKARVEIPVHDSFDRDAYSKVVTSSQLSQPSQPSINSQVSQALLYSSSQLETPISRHRYSSIIWDEDIEGVIPDSQEQPGSSSYKPSETPISKPATSSRQDTEVSTGTTTFSPKASTGSGTLDSASAELLNNFTQASYTARSSHSSSVQFSGVSSTRAYPIHNSSQEHQESEAQDIELSGGNLDKNIPSSSSAAQPRVEESSSPDFPPLPDSPLRQLETSSEERDPTQAKPSQTSLLDDHESSSIEFQTQQPLLRDETDDSVPSPHDSLVESSQNNQNKEASSQHSAPLDENIEQSQTLREESHQLQTFPPTERSVSNFEATWHAARTISSTPRPSQTLPAAPATPVQTPREEDSEDSSPAKTPDAITKSSFPRLSVDTQGSPLKSLDLQTRKESTGQRSQESSGSLPSPPFESAGSTAEQFAQLTSQNRQPTPPAQAYRSDSISDIEKLRPRGSIGCAIEAPSSQKQSSTPPLSANIIQSIENLEGYLPEPSAQPVSHILPSTPIQPLLATPAIEESNRNLSLRAPVIIDLTMDEAPPINPVLAKLQLRKAEATAKRAAERAASASRSLPQSPAPVSPAPGAAVSNDQAVAANQALPLHETIEEVALPTSEPISSPKDSPEAEAEAEATPTGLRMLSLGREEYVVPLPMVSYARDIYVNAIRSCRNQRYAFLTDEVFDPSLVKEIDSMIEDLDKLCNHQDLIVDDFSTQKLESVERQAKWAENVSTKCIFLAEFLALMQTEAKQIAILVRPGRMLEILEALLMWHDFVYNRADKSGYTGNISGGPMKISLIPTQGEILGFDPPSIVIAFDSTYASFPFLKDLRTDPTFPNRPVPLLSLIITNSIEHLEKCFDRNIEPIERKIKLVSCLTQIGDGVGKLSSEYHGPPIAAKAVAEYLINGAIESTWPLPPMPDIEDLDLNIESSQPEPPKEEPSGPVMPSHDVSLSQAAQLGLKRELETGEATNRDSPKRQKLTPVPGEQDISHVSDTVLHTSSEIPASVSAEASEIIAKTDKIDDEQEDQVTSLLKRVNDLEIQLRSKEAAESELRQINQDLETRCQDYESSIASIQPKYQEALNDRGHFEHEITLSSLRQTHLRKDLENKDAELAKLREQKAAADAELIEARIALASSAIPEIAEMGNLKEELAKERSEKELLQKRLTNMQGDLEYMRNNYQNSSTLAAEHASENLALQTELKELREKAKANTVRIHQIQKSGEIEEYVRRVRELKEENGELERELERKGEELRAMMNGRRATRGTSVPRSPRMGTGGTMSPGLRPIGRAMQMGGIGMAMGGVVGAGNGGSRGNSPAPGELGGFRGTGTFVGEALFQERSTPGGVRWGNHLQQ